MTGPAGRRRAVVLGAVLILASVAAFAIALDRGRGPEKSEVVTAGPSSTTTTPGVGRRQVLADRAGGWTLFVVGDGHRRCLEVVVDRQPFGSLLCDAKPATDV
ncbi:MAG: hypothetical protein ACRDY5_08575, partial [Acidimicrobiales bacterium]